MLMAYDRSSRGLSQSVMPLFDLFKTNVPNGGRGPGDEDQQQRHRIRTKSRSWLRKLIGPPSSSDGEGRSTCTPAQKAGKDNEGPAADRSNKENGPAIAGNRSKPSHGSRSEERYFLSQSYSAEDDAFIDVEGEDNEEGNGPRRPAKRAGSSRGPSHRVTLPLSSSLPLPPLSSSLPLPPDPAASKVIPTPTFRLVERPQYPVALGKRAEALADTETGSRARGKRRATTTFRRKTVSGTRCRRRPTSNCDSMDDEAFARRHRPMEVAEKRILRREAELGRYRAYMAELRVNSPELWSRRIT